MDLKKVPVGKNAPYDVNVIIEIPMGGNPVKYELDKESGTIFVDRLPAHGDVLSLQLRLHSAHALRGRRSGGMRR
jgi:inorganic pyrophosphatase